jgi:hypothetical protein
MDVFVSLTADVDSPLSNVRLYEVTLAESFEVGSPILTIVVADPNGSLMSYRKLDTDTNFFLSFGNRYLESETSIPLRISTVQYDNTRSRLARANMIEYRITFMAASWNKLLSATYNRAWTNTLFSDVITEIANECDMEPDVEPTRITQELIIQPYMSNIHMLRYIKEKAKSAVYDDSLIFGSTMITGKLIFKTLSKMIDDQRSSAVSGSLPTIALMPQEPDDEKRKRMWDDNGNFPPNFVFFENTEYYMNTNLAGGGGATAQYYNFETDELITSEIGYGNLNVLTLSENVALKENDQMFGNVVFGGRDINTAFDAENIVTDAMASFNAMNIVTEGCLKFEIGQLIEILIPANDRAVTSSAFSETYSGFYIVITVTHEIEFRGSGTFITKLKLTRQGFDGKTLDGFITTKNGKFI